MHKLFEKGHYLISVTCNYLGKSLVCCNTAWDDFEKIVNTLGGSMEKERTEEIKKRITVFPDDYGGKAMFCLCECLYINIKKKNSLSYVLIKAVL